MNTLRGKNVLVTGGASGIGGAISLELGRAGAHVCVHYRSSAAEAEETVRAITAGGGRAFTVAGDLTRESDVTRLSQTIEEEFGVLDVLVNNAGDLIDRKDLTSISLDFFRAVMAVNIDSMVLVTREVTPFLVKADGSSIVNVASLAGKNFSYKKTW